MNVTFKWQDGCIAYIPSSQLTNTAPSDSPKLESTLKSIPAIQIEDPETWQSFHASIFPYIKTWAHTTEQHHIAQAWKQAIMNGINQSTTWSDIQNLMQIENFKEYYHYINACPLIKQHLKIHLDVRTGTIYYKPITPTQSPIMHLITPIQNNTTLNNTLSSIQLPDLNDQNTHTTYPPMWNTSNQPTIPDESTSNTNTIDRESDRSWKETFNTSIPPYTTSSKNG
jgi:hypothetical protein